MGGSTKSPRRRSSGSMRSRSRSRSPRWSCSATVGTSWSASGRPTAEGIGVPNAMHLVHTYPIFLNRVAPFFVGKDARQLEPLLWELYRHDDNYKYQGLALWVCVAAAEFAILDLLGKLAGKSIGDLLGGVKRRDIAVYRASGNRGNTPEEEVAYLKRIVGRDRREGAEVPARRPHEQERRLAAGPDRAAHPDGPRGVRQGDDALRRLEQLLRRARRRSRSAG